MQESQQMPLAVEDGASWPLQRSQKVVLVVDLVESVRLMEADEVGQVTRWRDFVAKAGSEIIPRHQGRLVKSLGDGLMVEFDAARQAVSSAVDMHALMAQGNVGLPTEKHMALRAGLNSSHVYSDALDIYGSGVNLAARMAGLAGPGETVISAGLRDELTDGLDASIEDLGDCYLKHINQPVRAYRVGAAGPRPLLPARNDYAVPLQSSIAVIPFEARGNEPEYLAIGELIADGVSSQLGRTAELRVISRLSCTAFRGHDASVALIAEQLGVAYVLGGSYVVSSGKLLITAELADARSSQVMWSERLTGDVGDLLLVDSELVGRIASATHGAILQVEVQRALLRPLPTLESCSLLLSGIALTHRASPYYFDRAREVLELLVERHPRAARARAWLAKWYILRVVRGMSDAPDQDARRAIEQTERALDSEPDSALALAIQGHALCHLSRDVEGAIRKIDAAIELSPNESLAWLYKSVWSSMWGETAASVHEAEVASHLSPIDPMKYYYDMILATGLSINGEYDRAIEIARRSLRADRHHQPTLRVLMYSLAQHGEIEEARGVLDRLIRENPNLTVSSYLGMGGEESQTRKQVAAVLRRLGLAEK